jgi:TonB-dependent SusC/RagA subfamily outer membrane receptor
MSTIARFASALVALATSAGSVRAQMTVSGRVMGGDRAVAGASVRIPDLGLETRTTSDGSFNLLIPGSRVLGQRVRIVARDRRYGSQALDIALEGKPLVVEFTLGTAVEAPPRRDTARAGPSPALTPAPSPPPTFGVRPQLDSTAFLGASASVDLASALAGRIPGLVVRSAATPGASASMVYRGPRSISGSVEPLVVVDGVPIDTRSFDRGERFGLGGFDYGTPIQDLAIDDIAAVTLLDGAAAAARYGSRAANGVLLVTTKRAGNAGWEYSVATRFVEDGPTRFPAFQDQYGQGLGGQFEFFDGTGGGINDNAAENWGPALQGQPVVQASYREPKRPEVRPWVPRSLNVRDYFGNGGTFDAHGAVGFGDDLSGRHVRVAVNARNATGITPGASMTRLGATLGATVPMTARLALSGSAQLVHTSADARAGTGFDESNPMSQFVRMGRQVDLDSLRAHVEATEQINWIYTGFNNPYFQPLRNTNSDSRTHAIAGAALTYNVTAALQLTINGAYDHADQHRDFDVAAGWVGGYPTTLGRGDFSGGGSQRQTLTTSASLFGASVSTTKRAIASFAVDALVGADVRSENADIVTAITDRPSSGSSSQSNDDQKRTNSVTSAYGTAQAARGPFTLAGGLRAEMPSTLETGAGGAAVTRETSLFPTVSATYDVTPATRAIGLHTAGVRARWWRAGNEVTSRSLADAYAGLDQSVAPTFGIAADGVAGPEITTGLSLGVETDAVADRLSLSVTAYRERSSNLVVVTPDIDGHPFTSQDARVSNTGIESELTMVPLAGIDHRWAVVAWLAKNNSSVDAAGPGATTQVPLGPTFSGATVYAAANSPLGVIVGTRALRDANGRLLLKNGVPMADQSGPVVLGSIQPDWSASVASRARVADLELDVLVEARMGGHVFSATNRWGQSSGTLAETLVGRDTGIVVAGIDSVTGQPNAVNVSTESYFHALGGITDAFVYDASFAKLRDVRLSYVLPLRFVAGFRDRTLRMSFVGRNLFTWSKSPNIDSETALSTGVFQGLEMGQLPGTTSFGFSLSIAP